MADPAEQPVDTAAELGAAVGQTIEACGGDPIAAVRALIVANSMLEKELQEVLREGVARIYAGPEGGTGAGDAAAGT